MKKLKTVKKPRLICCNLCSSETTGEDFDKCTGHWIGLCVEAKTITIYDSGGEDNWHSNEYLREFIAKQGRRVIFNNYQYQPFLSDRCGLYVLSFFNAMAERQSFKKFIELFSTENLAENDEIVWSLFKRDFLGEGRKKCRNLR